MKWILWFVWDLLPYLWLRTCEAAGFGVILVLAAIWGSRISPHPEVYPIGGYWVMQNYWWNFLAGAVVVLLAESFERTVRYVRARKEARP